MPILKLMPKKYMTIQSGLNIPCFMLIFLQLRIASMAPEGCEAGFFLMPIAPNLEDTPELQNHYL